METVRKKPDDELKRLTFLRKNGLSDVRAAWVTEQIRLRKRAEEKFPGTADGMFFTQVGLEQATDCFLAEYIASRFPENLPAADLCCGIGGNLTALAARHPVLGVDRSPLTAAAAGKNLEFCKKQHVQKLKNNETLLYEGDKSVNYDVNTMTTDSVEIAPEKQLFDLKYDYSTEINSDFSDRVECCGVEEFLERYSETDFPCVHIDPDRRSLGGRTTRLAYFEPPQDVVERVISGRLLAAVKLAPGSDIPTEWLEKAAEFEWIGRNRECRQLVAWFRGDKFSQEPAVYRATILDAHSSRVRSTFCGTPNVPIPGASGEEKYLFDVDSTILAAGLEGALAEKYSLRGWEPGGIYLRGNEPILEDAGLSCFEILEKMPLDRKQIIRTLRKYSCANMEIKKRGDVPLPEEVRKWITLSKTGEKYTLFLVRSPRNSAAFLTKRFSMNSL